MGQLKKNVIANLIGKVWSAIMGLAFVPLYIKFLGIELYGLVGFYTMLAAIFIFLDFGLSSTLNRELARSNGNAADADETRDLVRSLEYIYWCIAVLLGVILLSLAPLLSEKWLSSENISKETMREAVLLLGLVIAIQWPFSLYSGGLYGLQRQVLLNILTCIFATIRGVGAVLILWLVSPTIQSFFIWQAAFGLITTLIMAKTLWRCLPPSNRRPAFNYTRLKLIWKFAAGITTISILGIIIRQLDKVLLSGMLSLEDFGYYTIAGVLAASVSYVVGPIRSAIFPNFSQLVAEGKSERITQLYHRSAQIMAVAILPLTLWLCIFSKPILFLWTQDAEVAQNAHLILSVLVLGVAIKGIISPLYVIQLAYGWTSLSVYINIFIIIVLIPAMVWMVKSYGAVGAAGTWTFMALLQILLSITFMHMRYLKGEAGKWYLVDTLLPVLTSLICVALGFALLPEKASGFVQGFFLLSILAVAYMLTILATPETRRMLSQLFTLVRKDRQ